MKLIKKTNEEKGFTLIELVVVIAILAVLALILIPSITGYVANAQHSKNEANVRNIYTTAVLIDTSKDIKDGELQAEVEKEISQDDVDATYTVEKNADVITVTLTDDDKVYSYSNNKLTSARPE